MGTSIPVIWAANRWVERRGDGTSRHKPPGCVLTTGALGTWVAAMTATRLGSAPSTGPGTGASDRMRPLFGVHHRTPVEPSTAALFITDTGAARGRALRNHHRSVHVALTPARFERDHAGCVTSTSNPNQI